MRKPVVSQVPPETVATLGVFAYALRMLLPAVVTVPPVIPRVLLPKSISAVFVHTPAETVALPVPVFDPKKAFPLVTVPPPIVTEPFPFPPTLRDPPRLRLPPVAVRLPVPPAFEPPNSVVAVTPPADTARVRSSALFAPTAMVAEGLLITPLPLTASVPRWITVLPP